MKILAFNVLLAFCAALLICMLPAFKTQETLKELLFACFILSALAQAIGVAAGDLR